MVKSSEYNAVIRDIIYLKTHDKNGFIDASISLIGHSRLVTDGSQGKDYNNQPVQGLNFHFPKNLASTIEVVLCIPFTFTTTSS